MQLKCDFAWYPPAVIRRGTNAAIYMSHESGSFNTNEIKITMVILIELENMSCKPKE
jgi:hypothetical protein